MNKEHQKLSKIKNVPCACKIFCESIISNVCKLKQSKEKNSHVSNNIKKHQKLGMIIILIIIIFKYIMIVWRNYTTVSERNKKSKDIQ